MKTKINTRILVAVALLVALQIVFERLLSVGTSVIRISLGFFPVAIAGMLFGSLGGGMVSVIADIVGMLLFSKGEIYFFPLTISQFLYGFGFGMLLHRENVSYLKITIFTICQFILINLFINSVWLYFYSLLITGTKKAFWVIFSGRLITASVNLPLQIIGVNLICRYLKKPLQKLGWRKA